MKIIFLVALQFSLLFTVNAHSQNAKNSGALTNKSASARLNRAQIQAWISEFKERAALASKESDRRVLLAKLHRGLDREFQKGLKASDDTFYFVNRLLLQVEYIQRNNCTKSRSLLEGNTPGNSDSVDRESRRQVELREGLELWTVVCDQGGR